MGRSAGVRNGLRRLVPVVGQLLTYYPPAKAGGCEHHFPAVVLSVEKRVLVRVFMAGAESGVLRRVSVKRLVDQGRLAF